MHSSSPIGLVDSTKILVNSLERLDQTEYKFTGCIATSEKVYQEYEYVKFIKNNSNLNVNSNNPIVDTAYPICGIEITSEGDEN